MDENYVTTNRVRELWEWIAERWAYFTVVGIAYLLVYYATGSTMQAVSAIVIFMCMWLGALWVDRLPREKQIWWIWVGGLTVILLAAT
nr:hypothetical protein [Parabacteroides sp.]